MRLPTDEIILNAQILDNSEIMSEFFKITAEDNKKTIEEKTLEVEEDIIEEAHKEPAYVAESLGDGALVENQNEQQNKIIDIVNKMPEGTLINEYAKCFNDLIKLAEECESEGEFETSEIITNIAEGVLNKFPFVSAP